MSASTDDYAAEIRAVLDERRMTRGCTAYVLLTLTGEQGAMSAAVGVYSSDELTIMGTPEVSLVIHAATAPSFHEAAKLAEGWIEKSLPALVVRAMSEGATFSDALTKIRQGYIRAPFKVDDDGRVDFHAELDNEILSCEAYLTIDGRLDVYASGDLVVGVEDFDAYFSAGVYTSLDGFRRGDRRDFKAVVEAASGGK